MLDDRAVELPVLDVRLRSTAGREPPAVADQDEDGVALLAGLLDGVAALGGSRGEMAVYDPPTEWELSRWVMQYGSSPYRVLLASLVVIVVCALLFSLTGGVQETWAGETITYSIQDPESAPWWWLADVLARLVTW